MSAHLDRLVSTARSSEVEWSPDRASRILSGAIAKKESRARRDRVVRRGLFVAGAAAVVVLLFIRSASSSPSHESASLDPQPEALAAHAQGDGGYARD